MSDTHSLIVKIYLFIEICSENAYPYHFRAACQFKVLVDKGKLLSLRP